MYNLTPILDANNTLELAVGVNTMTDSMLGILILVSFGLVLLSALKNYPFKQAFAATTYLCAMIAILLRLIGLISDKIAIITFILAGLGTVMMLFTES